MSDETLQSCQDCGATYPAGRSMSAHRLTHTNFRVDCGYCSFRPLARNLESHVRARHGNKQDEHLELDLRSLEDKDGLIREQAEQIAELTRELARIDGLRERYWNRLKATKQ